MKMQNAEMEFVAFDAQDVIATSGTFKLSGYKNGTLNDIIVRFNGEDYDNPNTLQDAIIENMGSMPGIEILFYINDDERRLNFAQVFDSDAGDEQFEEVEFRAVNGVYKWINEQTAWVHQ